ncbi:MAG: hypothetical protein R3308_00960, partial [Thiohalobacterales bacterium]|nr:hypothetical protein [Thiohalobacterales bacterium]
SRRMPGSSVFNDLDAGLRRHDELIRDSLDGRVRNDSFPDQQHATLLLQKLLPVLQIGMTA